MTAQTPENPESPLLSRTCDWCAEFRDDCIVTDNGQVYICADCSLPTHENPESEVAEITRDFLVHDNVDGWSGQAWDWESVDRIVQQIKDNAAEEEYEASITITVTVDQRLREDLTIADYIRQHGGDDYVRFLLDD